MAVRPLSVWDVSRSGGAFRAVTVPCTVAGVLRDCGEWEIGDPGDFESEHWTFRCRFPGGAEDLLECHGLTPNAQVVLNGVPLAIADSMFRPLQLPVTLEHDNVLEIHFPPLQHTPRKPRARWRTRLLDQQWRWVRTTAIGRMPSWGPLFGTVGPWREVRLRTRTLDNVQVQVSLDGNDGIVTWKARPRTAKRDVLMIGTARAELRGDEWSATMRIRDAERWWPHTHGGQPRYHIALESGLWSDDIAFRAIKQLDPFALFINDVDVFCRGTCWMPCDPVGLAGDPRPALLRAKSAHFNMLRVSANTVYESDAFYSACDALGILVWQDFMFASLDYPFADAAFAHTATEEATAFLHRTATRACLATLCGNSEVEMQALLVGQPIETPPFYGETLARLCGESRPDVPYVSGTPGGSNPVVQPHTGWSHYYGVGVYERPLHDARTSQVRFATECLGFAQRPSRASQADWHALPWSERITRTDGVGDLVHTHAYYLRERYALDADTLSARDPVLCAALAEILPGEVMMATFAEWRTRRQCRGALIWKWRDLWPGCGLGLLDAANRDKAAMHYVRRVLAPTAALFSDEGLNGLELHLINEREPAVSADLTLEVFTGGQRIDVHASRQSVAARGHEVLMLDALLGRFADLQRAWRFGQADGDLVVARWGATPAAFFFPGAWPIPQPRAIGLRAERTGTALRVAPRDFAHTVIVDGDASSDNYFHLAPGELRVLDVSAGPLRVTALGAVETVHLP